jgi:hypothetical protein
MLCIYSFDPSMHDGMHCRGHKPDSSSDFAGRSEDDADVAAWANSGFDVPSRPPALNPKEEQNELAEFLLGNNLHSDKPDSWGSPSSDEGEASSAAQSTTGRGQTR